MKYLIFLGAVAVFVIPAIAASQTNNSGAGTTASDICSVGHAENQQDCLNTIDKR